MDLSNLRLGHRIILGAGIVLIIDLLFFPWHSVGPFNLQATDSPNAIYGILALLITLAMVVQVILDKLTSVELPEIGTTPWERLHMIAGIVVGALLLLKLIVETTALGFGAWLGVLLGIGLAAGGFLLHKEAAENTPI